MVGGDTSGLGPSDFVQNLDSGSFLTRTVGLFGTSLAIPRALIYARLPNMKTIAIHVALTLAVGTGLGLLIWDNPPAVWGPTQIVGICLLVVGFVFWSVARFQLGASFTVSAQAKKLVTHGLYSKIRNPIYLFGSCVMVGTILTMGRPMWLWVFALVIPLQFWRMRKEAAVLEASFGDEYRKYRAATWF